MTTATVVDHKVKHEGNQTLMWDQANWQPLCKQHHDSAKQMLEKSGSVQVVIGEDGWPVERAKD
ncbi:HNH endonuclease [Variovorax sp. S12S4]|uniref:HNH endonuclease n=1 Tax=Variovorax sp. S12S4 TaxID=3029170 RepID=UPI0031593041